MNHINRKGFTLIELLVVIAIISILAAILFPVFAQAREKARATACINNEKQIGTAIVQYTQDYDEMLPPAYWSFGKSDPNNSSLYVYDLFPWFVQPYIKTYSVWACPSDSNPESLALQASSFSPLCQGAPIVTYTVNEALFPRSGETDSAFPQFSYHMVSLSQLGSPSSVIAIAETSSVTQSGNALERPVHAFTMCTQMMNPGSAAGYKGSDTSNCNDFYKATSAGSIPEPVSVNAVVSSYKAGAGNGDVWPDYYMGVSNTNAPRLSYTSQMRHQGGANYVFADGHAKWCTTTQAVGSQFLWGECFYPQYSGPCPQTSSWTKN